MPAHARDIAPDGFQAFLDLLGERAQVGLLRGIGIAALRDDASAAPARQRAVLSQARHRANQQADQVVRAGFAVEGEL
ncbi:hypothetical protein [Cupriavidus sp. amp6]|uniref:hypothetical protein n=1 Tax=Cupriavidus sp. amp6 TaxID=388051 RepID=UPI00056C5AC8|nr:hypothetical protein [Cupriavidus sp. amp6]